MGSDSNDVDTSCSVRASLEQQEISVSSHNKFSWKKFLAAFGVPCLISVAAIDPGNLEVDLQAGSTLGYTLVWALLVSSVVGWLLQTLAAHITICSGSHLAELYARAYDHDKILYYSVFTIAELAIIAFDIAEVVGTAFALQLLFGFSLWVGMLLSALDTMVVLFLQRYGMTKIEIIVEGLLFILSVCLFYEFALSRPAFSEILQGALVPSLGKSPREGAILAVGLLGSVIMSHNLFLHSWLVKDRMLKSDDASSRSQGEVAASDIAATCQYATIEAAAIFIVTFLINGCVLSVSASLPSNLVPDDIGLKDAGALLQRLLGSEFASKAWAVALLSSGHAATVTGTMSSQAVCEGFLNIREGNSSSIVILGTRVVAIVPALLVALVAGENGSDRLVVLSQVVLSLALPFAVIPMFKILGHITGTIPISPWNRRLIWAGYFAFGLLIIANIYVLLEIVRQINKNDGGIATKLVLVVSIAAVALIWKLLITPMYLKSNDDIEEGSFDLGEARSLLADSKAPYG